MRVFFLTIDQLLLCAQKTNTLFFYLGMCLCLIRLRRAVVLFETRNLCLDIFQILGGPYYVNRVLVACSEMTDILHQRDL